MADDSSYSIFVADKPVAVSHDYTGFSKLADGAYCTLWRACKDGQWVVVKALQPPYRGCAQYEMSLRKEYDILSMFDSPYVVKVYSYGDVAGYGSCIVMEWIDGVTLKEWLHGAGPQPRRADRERVALELVKAVAYVHSLQAVHRDLKPSNIMITRNGSQVKLINFGLSDTDSFAILKQPAGTKGYVSPEQSRGSATDERNDIYSLGIILQDMQLGWLWHGVVRKAVKPIDERIRRVTEIPGMMRRCRRRVRMLALVLVAIMLTGICLVVYNKTVTPRPQFEVVARFQYSNMIFESWGGGLATMRTANHSETTVEVPATVANNGFKYKVDEVTFHAFQGDARLQAVIMPGGIHVMKAAFRDCPHLTDIYIKGIPPLIGNAQWPTEIDNIFDPVHFSTICIHVPKTCRAAYAASPWNRFKRYVCY